MKVKKITLTNQFFCELKISIKNCTYRLRLKYRETTPFGTVIYYNHIHLYANLKLLNLFNSIQTVDVWKRIFSETGEVENLTTGLHLGIHNVQYSECRFLA